MKIILKLVLLNILVPLVSISQIDDLAKFNTYRFYEEEIDPGHYFQNSNFPSGGKKVEYKNRTDSSAFRTEYFKTGLPRIESLVKYSVSVDTVIRFEKGIEKIVVEKQYGYYPTGNYVEYQNKSKVRSIGKFKNGLKVGEWKFYDRRNNKMVVNYSEYSEHEGEFRIYTDIDGMIRRHSGLEGKYQEFYFHHLSETYTLKIDGQFGKKKYLVKVVLRNGNVVERIKTEIRRTGIWTYYSLDGSLLERTIYEWVSP